jgi:hypothetical protein
VARNTHTNLIALHANSGRGAVQRKSGHQAESVTDIPYDVGTVRGGAFLAEPDVDGLAKLAPSSRHWAAHGCRSTGSTDDRANNRRVMVHQYPRNRSRKPSGEWLATRLGLSLHPTAFPSREPMGKLAAPFRKRLPEYD